MNEEKDNTESTASEDIKIVNREKLRELLGIEELEKYVHEVHTKTHEIETGALQDNIEELKQRFEADIPSKQKIGKRYFFLNDQLANMKSVLKDRDRCLVDILNYITEKEEYQKQDAYLLQDWLHDLREKLEGSEKEDVRECGTTKEPALNREVAQSQPTDSKEPSKCEFCGRELIFYNDKWICGHGCTKPALKGCGYCTNNQEGCENICMECDTGYSKFTPIKEKEPIADPCNPCIYNNLISCNICDYYIASHKKKPEFESKIIMDDGRVIPWSEYKKEKEGILGSKSIPSDMPVKSQTRTSKEPFCCHSTGLGRCEVTGEDCKIGSTDYCPKEKEPSDEITEQLKRCEECKQLLKVAISEELIGEFRDDWNFIQSKIDWYLDQVAEKKITIDIMEIMIFFYLNSRGRKWQKR